MNFGCDCPIDGKVGNLILLDEVLTGVNKAQCELCGEIVEVKLSPEFFESRE